MTQPQQSDYEDFFDGVGGGGAPSFEFGGVGGSITGEIVDQYRTVVTDPSGNKKTYPDGGEIPQLNVTLQTKLRNWEGVKKVPTDPETGQPKPPSEDDGTRRIYVKYDMRRAIAVACRAAKERNLRNGGLLWVKQSGAKETGKGNPLPLYEARYKPPAQDEGFFEGQGGDEGQQSTPPASQPPAQQAPPQDTTGTQAPAGWGDEPPF